MRLRRVVTTGLLLGSVLAGPAEAAPVKGKCVEITDPLDDTAVQNDERFAGVAVDQTVDIAAVSLGVLDDTVRAVLRVQSADDPVDDPPSDWMTVGTRGTTSYRIEVGAGRRRLFFQTWVSHPKPMGQDGGLVENAVAGRVGGRGYRVPAFWDPKRDEIGFTAPFSVFGNVEVRGAKLYDIVTTAARTYSDAGQLAPGVPSRVWIGDTASGPGTHGTNRWVGCRRAA